MDGRNAGLNDNEDVFCPLLVLDDIADQQKTALWHKVSMIDIFGKPTRVREFDTEKMEMIEKSLTKITNESGQKLPFHVRKRKDMDGNLSYKQMPEKDETLLDCLQRLDFRMEDDEMIEINFHLFSRKAAELVDKDRDPLANAFTAADTSKDCDKINSIISE